ncbi:MAG: glycosyltransferase [Actinobacteria bacterium]|nr:glycosyltransferase [Actinomycetota bacterium]
MIKVLMAEFLLYDSVFQVGSHAYAKQFLDEGDTVGWLAGEWYLPKILTSKDDFVKSYNLWKNDGRWFTEKLWTYSPFVLFPSRNVPFLRSKFLAQNSIKYTYPPIKKILEKNDFAQVDLLWFTNPITYSAIFNLVNFKKSIYRIADNNRGFNIWPKSVLEIEKEIIKRVDLVFVTAKNILREVEKIRKEGVYYLPNGVNLDKFKQTYPVPAEYKKLGNRPVVLYVGAIKDWFDVDLIREAASKLNDYAFVFIGPTGSNFNLFNNLSNVYLLGPKSPDEIVAYIQHANVGIIPFKKNVLTDSISPIKLFEYLASGLSVVSVALDEVTALGLPVFTFSSKDQFCSGIKDAVENPPPKSLLKNSVKDHTWENRFELVKKLINHRL